MGLCAGNYNFSPIRLYRQMESPPPRIPNRTLILIPLPIPFIVILDFSEIMENHNSGSRMLFVKLERCRTPIWCQLWLRITIRLRWISKRCIYFLFPFDLALSWFIFSSSIFAPMERQLLYTADFSMPVDFLILSSISSNSRSDADSVIGTVIDFFGFILFELCPGVGRGWLIINFVRL